MSSTNDSYTCLVSVVGYSAHGFVYSSSQDGTGKSCLCSRFCYGGIEDYVSDHPSLLAFHEFESQVLSTEHFIYWGPTERTYNLSKGRDVTVRYEVVEHTVFYHDESSKPFPQLMDLLDSLKYSKKILQLPECSRKISYYSRDAIGFPEKYKCLPYPTNISKLARGFIVAVDVSMDLIPFEQQLTAIQAIAYELRKQPLIIVATKRDQANMESLQRLLEWTSKKKLTLIETSSHENVNVSDAFRLVASKALSKKVKLSDTYYDYADGTGQLLALRSNAKSSFMTYLKDFVHSASTSLSAVENTSAYKDALYYIGKFSTDDIMARHLLKLRNSEINVYSGVVDNPEMRLELLEDHIADQVDFIAHNGTLTE